MRNRMLFLIGGLALSVATPVLAQQHQQMAGQGAPDMAAMMCGGEMPGMAGGMMPGMKQGMKPGMKPGMMQDMHGMGMMEMMGPPTPAMVLHHKAELKLTAAQVTKLEALQKDAQPECTHHMQAAMAAHMAANKLLDVATPNFGDFSNKLKEAANHMVEGHVVMAKAAVAARDVLTPAQQQTLKTRMEKMHKKP